MRKVPLVDDQYYHILNRSIAKYIIFNNINDYSRMIELLKFYRYNDLPCKYSKYSGLTFEHQKHFMKEIEKNDRIVEIIAYCLMPTHLHLILKQTANCGIRKYMTSVLDGYTRYFNIKHIRKGPLWEGHFKSILVDSDEQILHLTRYIHLNPVSAGIADRPQDWSFSSYKEYVKEPNICVYKDIINMPPKDYKEFVCDRISYQKELSSIKQFLFETYTG